MGLNRSTPALTQAVSLDESLNVVALFDTSRGTPTVTQSLCLRSYPKEQKNARFTIKRVLCSCLL